MGRHPWTSRLTVEECPIYLSAEELRRSGLIARDAHRIVGEVSWPLSDGSSLGKLKLEAMVTRHGNRTLFIHRQVMSFGGKLSMGAGQAIPLTATQPYFGGRRFWFVCECGRRAGKIYLPTGETAFRCRLCCDLTYQSSQEHNTRNARLRTFLETIRPYVLTS